MDTVVAQSSLADALPMTRNGLFRDALAGRGCSLTDAFQSLEKSPLVQGACRHGGRDLFGARIPLDPRDGVGYWELTRIGSGIYVVVENFVYRSQRLELVPGDDLIQFYFKLSGDLTLELSSERSLRINRPSVLVYRQPRGVNIEEWTAASARERSVAIVIDRRSLIAEFFSSGCRMPAVLEAMIEGDRSTAHFCQIPLVAEMFEIATRLVDHPYNGSLGLIYTAAVTFELLCRTISALQDIREGAPSARLSEREIRSLHLAQHILAKDFTNPPTISELARKAGISETSLKRGFKAIFGETVFAYSLRCRMGHAMRLLTERQMPVCSVSEAVGYSHHTSFATAFRRYFGVAPKDVRPAFGRV